MKNSFMKKIVKTVLVLLITELSLVSCKNLFIDSLNDYDNINQKPYLTFSINESGERKAAPNDLTWDEVYSIDLAKNGTVIKTWTKANGQTAYAQMKADSSIVLDVGTYNFAITLKDFNGCVLQTGTLENVKIKAGANPLNFKTTVMMEGKGNLTVGIKWLEGYDAKFIEKAEIKLYDMDMNSINGVVLNDQINPYYGIANQTNDYTSGTYENIDCGNYFVKINFVVDRSYTNYKDYLSYEKQTIELVEIQNKRSTTYIYEHKKGTRIFPVEFKDENGNSDIFIDGYTPPAYANEKELPSADKIKIPDGCIFDGWYVGGKKVTSFNFYYDGKCTIVAKFKTVKTNFDDISYGDYLFVTNAEDISKIVSVLSKDNPPENITLDLSELSITEIGEYAFKDCTSITEIILPDSVTKIGKRAFIRCESLTKIELPEGLKTIADYAFLQCYRLTDITIPASVETIEEHVFWNCIVLSEIKIESGSKLSSLPTGLTTGVRNDGCIINIVVPYDVSLETIPNCNYICTIPSDITEIEEFKFSKNAYLKEIVIPANVKKIGKSAFDYCENLEKVTFESGSQLTEIGKDAFNGCSKLNGITLPTSLETIGEKAFYSCSSLEKIEMPESVTSLGASIFALCSDLKTFKIYYHQIGGFQDELKTSGNSFTVIISDGTKKITESSLSFASIVSVSIPESVEVIEKGAFANCSKLNTVTLAANSKLKEIGENAFQGCTSLTSITLPSGLKTLSSGCFAGCTKLSTLELPKSLEYVGKGILSGCSSLSEVTIPEAAKVEDDASKDYPGKWIAGHTFEEAWTYDETHHWHKATCMHPDEKGDYGEHDFVYDEITPATESTPAQFNAHCVCGYTTVVTANGPYPATYKFTETVKVLPAGTTGSCGKTGDFVQFGDFPQAKAADGILFNPRPEDNGYYIGSDGNYYAKLNDVYYKVEPIKWRVCNTNFNGTGNALFLADNVLTAGILFDKNFLGGGKADTRTIDGKTIYTNNYEYSFVRAYLNGLTYIGKTENDTTYTDKGFLQTAFTSEAQSLIQNTEVDNSIASTTHTRESGTTPWSMSETYKMSNTTDKVFLLSVQEATDTGNGFVQYSETSDKRKRIKSTEFAVANGATSSTYDTTGDFWMCRSSDRTTVYKIIYFGKQGTFSSDTFDKTNIGIAPALCVSSTLLNQN